MPSLVADEFNKKDEQQQIWCTQHKWELATLGMKRQRFLRFTFSHASMHYFSGFVCLFEYINEG